jgi:hypothetical protein
VYSELLQFLNAQFFNGDKELRNGHKDSSNKTTIFTKIDRITHVSIVDVGLTFSINGSNQFDKIIKKS